jgi:hypothetical protein
MKANQLILSLACVLLGACATKQTSNTYGIRTAQPVPRPIDVPVKLTVSHNGPPVTLRVTNEEMPYILTQKGAEIDVYGNEPILLHYLLRHKGKKVSRDQIIILPRYAFVAATHSPDMSVRR